MARIRTQPPVAPDRLWTREADQLDGEVLAWFEARRIAMRNAFEALGWLGQEDFATGCG
jgi:hypothetical protein